MPISRLRDFVTDFTALIDQGPKEPRVIADGGALLKDLVRHDDWVPAAFAEASEERYQQYLLHCDPAQRFSVVSFVWGPAQKTPVHEHRTWGLIGMLRNAEFSQPFVLDAGKPVACGNAHRLEPGDLDVVSPDVGDIHRVSNVFEDRASISIHVYGANISAIRRFRYDRDGNPHDFSSSYGNETTPNLWDLAVNP